MIDFQSVRITGAFNVSRARVLWNDGTMKLFGKHGKIMEFDATEPTRAKGWRRAWLSGTYRGQIRLSAKCSTCGGWRAVTRPSAEELWGGA